MYLRKNENENENEKKRKKRIKISNKISFFFVALSQKSMRYTINWPP